MLPRFRLSARQPRGAMSAPPGPAPAAPHPSSPPVAAAAVLAFHHDSTSKPRRKFASTSRPASPIWPLALTGLLRHMDAMTTPAYQAIRDDFAMLDTWEDRYRYVMELGRALPPLDDALRTDANKVRGCASQVWLASNAIRPTNGGAPVLHFDGDSDAHLVRGLVAILLALIQDRPADAVLATDANAAFRELGLGDHLTPQRSNGFASMVARVRADAAACLGAPA
jgi:cysteine desulfuration protein SufE